jgi:hypothetical protein
MCKVYCSFSGLFYNRMLIWKMSLTFYTFTGFSCNTSDTHLHIHALETEGMILVFGMTGQFLNWHVFIFHNELEMVTSYLNYLSYPNSNVLL